jgi:hypothetical protein
MGLAWHGHPMFLVGSTHRATTGQPSACRRGARCHVGQMPIVTQSREPVMWIAVIRHPVAKPDIALAKSTVSGMLHQPSVFLCRRSSLLTTHNEIVTAAPLCVKNATLRVGSPKDRTFVMRSTDRGQSFSYLSTVAFDISNNSRACVLSSDSHGSNPACSVLEGFNEPYLSKMPHSAGEGGIILHMIMRSGGSQATPESAQSGHTGVVAGPMYRAFSLDAGRSWSIPQPVSDRGVTPTAALAGSVHVVGYGRPQNCESLSLLFTGGPQPAPLTLALYIYISQG